MEFLLHTGLEIAGGAVLGKLLRRKSLVPHLWVSLNTETRFCSKTGNLPQFLKEDCSLIEEIWSAGYRLLLPRVSGRGRAGI